MTVVELHADGGTDPLAAVALAVLLALAVIYVVLAAADRRWPIRRCVSWLLGCSAAALSVVGPWAGAADSSFRAHMVTHLLLGMVAPLLLVLAAPATLVLRSLPVASARRLSRLLTSAPLRVVTEPVVAATLSAGGLWLLYTTDLYPAMHHRPVVHLLVHLHLFVAGYLLTVAMISRDPLPHRRSFLHRSIVLVLTMAAHDVLAKHLYAHPPSGVSAADAEAGSMLMYYGGDAVELMIVVVLCQRWYRATRPRLAASRLAASLVAASGVRPTRTTACPWPGAPRRPHRSSSDDPGRRSAAG